MVFEHLRDSPLFSELTREQVDVVLEVAKLETYTPEGEAIVREGESANSFFLILSGEVEVTKRSASSDEEHHVTILAEGSHFGETALVREGHRTATVRARTPVTALVIDAPAVRAQRELHTWLIGFLLNLVAESCARLDVRSEDLIASLEAELETTKLRLETTRTLMYIVVLMSLYSIGLSINEAFRSDPVISKLTNTGLFLAFGVALFALIKGSKLPLSFFGVRAPDDWQWELGETLGTTAVFLAVLTGAKSIAVSTVPAFAGIPVFQPSTFDAQKLIFMTVYILLVPIQEMCIRGVLQGTIADALGKEGSSRWKAILPSNAIFAAVHAHMSPFFVAGVFFPGLFWGWLYSRQTSLLGACISHAIVGIYALDVLGLKTLLI